MMNCNYLRKTPNERRFDESVASKNFIWFVEMSINSVLRFNLLRFHQFGSTVLPESLLEYAWYAGGESWKGILMVADLEQLDMMDASASHNVKFNAKEVISPTLVKIPKNADGQLQFIGGDQVLRTPTLTRYHPSSRRSSRRPSRRIRRVSTKPTKSRLAQSITGKSSCHNGTGFTDDIFIVNLVYSYTSDIINAGC